LVVEAEATRAAGTADRPTTDRDQGSGEGDGRAAIPLVRR
jgi:hypothetical protein